MKTAKQIVSMPWVKTDKGDIDLYFEFLDLEDRIKFFKDLTSENKPVIKLPDFGKVEDIKIENKVKELKEEDLSKNSEEFIERFLNKHDFHDFRQNPKRPFLTYNDKKHEFELRPSLEIQKIVQEYKLKNKEKVLMNASFLEKLAIDLTKKEKSFSRYLNGFMPIIDKMSTEEIVNIFENAGKLVKTEKELLEIKNPDDLIKKVQDLMEKMTYPPNKELSSLIKQWESKKIDEKKFFDSMHKEIQNDIGFDISSQYINKVLYNVDQIKDNKKKLMNYFVNIVLKGAGEGIVSELELMEKSSVHTRDEDLLKTVVAEILNSKK